MTVPNLGTKMWEREFLNLLLIGECDQSFHTERCTNLMLHFALWEYGRF